MKYITHFVKGVLQKWMPRDTKPLGRWNIDYCTQKLNQKIDLSNEDHCGPCGQYIISKKVSIIHDNKNTIVTEKSIVFSTKNLQKSILLYPKK
jgi:hypothetical protein